MRGPARVYIAFYVHRSTSPHSTDFARRGLRRTADPMGRAHGRGARAHRRHHHPTQPSQCDRHAQRLLQRLSGAGGGVGRALAPAQGRSHQHLAHRCDRSVSAMGRARQDREPGSLGRAGGGRVFDRAGGRLRHPAHHRRHQSPCDPARGHRRPAERPAQGRWQGAHGRWRGHGHQGGDRAGVVAARRGQALRLLRGRSAPRAVRGNRRHVPGTRDPQRPGSVPAAHRRADRLHLR